LAREQRRLAAIVAADVVGYSRLMGRDESGTLARLREHRVRRLEPILARHGGRLVKLTGDGALAEFSSAVDALGAAIEFQQAMAEANRDQPEDTRIVFRVGLHLGDLIVDGDDLYGDGVNVAARLEGEAPPAGIVISGNVHDAVVGRVKATFDDLGRLALKNIERPIQAFCVRWNPVEWQASAAVAAAPTGSASPLSAEVPLSLPDRPSIAVLPFQNMSGDPEQEYFADGMVEDIITALSRFKSLFVIARNSSFTYKGKTVDIKQVGRELGVRYVLEGSVRKAGNRIRITGQLIDAASGAHIWADQFDGALDDVFTLQDRVTVRVVGAITPKLEQAEIERTARKPTESLRAYDRYLRGMASFYSGKPGYTQETRRLCCEAIELDPNFASAYAMAAHCDAVLIGRGSNPDRAAVAETLRLAQRAVELDRNDPLVLTRSAWAQAHVIRDLETAAGQVELALTLNPNLALAWAISGWIQVWRGEPELGIEHLSKAMRLSPLDPNIRFGPAALAHAYFMAGRNDEAWSSAERAVWQWPFPPAYRIAAAAAAVSGRSEEAARFVNLLLAVDPERRVSNLVGVLGPYRRSDDIERYKRALQLAGLPE